MQNKHIESLDNFSLWGGDNSFDISSETLTINRVYGLYSNITVTIYGICMLKSMGYDVKKIKFYLSEYENNHDFYNDFFITKDISGEIISTDEANAVLRDLVPTTYGLSSKNNRQPQEKDIANNIHALYKIYHYFFEHNNIIATEIDDIIKNNNISLDNTAFIWARKTDKPHENQVPYASSYMRELNKYTDFNTILLQTDDTSVVSEFMELQDSRIKYLKEIPYSNSSDLVLDKYTRGFHNNLNSVSIDSFTNSYGMSKIEYLRKFLALTYIASKSQYLVCYPGNGTTIIPILRQGFNNCILFFNNTTIIT